LDKYRLCRRPGEGRDPLLRFSKFSGNGDVVQIFIRSGRGSLDPGLPPGCRVEQRERAATSHDPADRQIRWIGISRRRLEAA